MSQTMHKYQFKFINFEKAFLLLKQRLEILKQDPENELVQAAVIQTFEFTFELSWKVMKAYLEYQGVNCEPYPREIIKLSFQSSLIIDGETWLNALNDRNKTSHTYNGEFSRQMVNRIIQNYYFIFEQLHNTIKSYDKK